MKKRVRFSPTVIVSLIVVAFLIFLRFYQIPQRFIFDIDVQYQALLAKTIINHFHIIWIGVSASNVGYYLGPGLVYLTAFLLWLSKGNPVILGYFASFISVLTIFSLYFVVKKVWNEKVAVFSSIIYGFTPMIINYDRKYWPIFVPLITVWFFYSLVKSQKETRWLILSSILIALSFHVHLSLMIFWLPLFWVIVKQFKRIKLITWILMIGSYLIITLPLIVFDFVHKFDNFLMPIRLIKTLLANKSTSHHLNLEYLVYFLALVFLIMVLIFILKIKRNFANVFLFCLCGLFILLYVFYPGPIQQYYLVFLFPLAAIAIAIFLQYLPKWVLFPLLSVFIIFNVYKFISQKSHGGLEAKKIFIEQVSKKINNDYYLDFDGNMDYEGWRYLFEAYGKKPSQSKTDTMFGWLYPNDISTLTPKLKLNVTTKAEKYYGLITCYHGCVK